MRIRGLGVIGEAVLELGPGLTVVTGETGAGKTMVVTGLGLLLGVRADAGAVRTGAASALVEGLVRVDPQGPVAARAREAGAELDDDVLVVARTVSSEGRSRAFVGGRSVPVGLLAELAPELVAVHGQSDQIRLQSPARQRDLLDRYAGDEVAGPLAAYGECFEQLRQVQARLDDIRTRGQERRAEADRLRYGLGEVEAVDPQPGEDRALATELSRLTHADALREAAELAHRSLSGDDDPMSETANAAALLAAAGHSLEAAAALDPALAELSTRLAEVGFLTGDIAAELSSYATGVDADPARLAAVQERVAALRGLTRRYADSGDVDAVLAWAQQAALRLDDLDDDDTLRVRLEGEVAELRPGWPAWPSRSPWRAPRPRPGWASWSVPSWPSWPCRTPGSRPWSASATWTPAVMTSPGWCWPTVAGSSSAGSASTRWSCCSVRTTARRPDRSRAAPPEVSCPA